MNLIDYTKKQQLSEFPDKIPENATDVNFYFSQSGWQEYSQTVVLDFYIDSSALENYKKYFQQKTIENQEISREVVFDRVGEDYIKNLTEDYNVYIILYNGDYNAKTCAVAISEVKNHIIFYAYENRW